MTSQVANRPNKIAKGFTKHLEARQAKGRQRKVDKPWIPLADQKQYIIGNLSIYGTCDTLAKRKGIVLRIAKVVKKEHPIDKGYFKEVYVLTEYGKKLLKNKLRKS